MFTAKKRIFSVILALFLISIPVLGAVPASAQGLDYTDYIVGITENANGESVVTIDYPLDAMYSDLYTNGQRVVHGTNTIEWPMRDFGVNQDLVFNSCYPNSPSVIDTSYIPSGSLVVREVDTSALAVTVSPLVDLYVINVNRSGADGNASKGSVVCANIGGTTIVESVLNKQSDTTAFRFMLYFAGVGSPNEGVEVIQRITVTHCFIKMTISSLVLDQAQSGKTNKILSAVEQKLAENGQKLDDVISQQEQTNEKLDGIQDSLDNQMQNEIDKAEEMGSGASDQAAAAIPDKSGDLLPAMQNLAASLSYQGTEAKLPFPQVSMPAIPGVCASFELIPAQDIDFGSYIQMIPATLIAIIQALCDIAIVLWAFKEAYGIYQYVISLNGGGTVV